MAAQAPPLLDGRHRRRSQRGRRVERLVVVFAARAAFEPDLRNLSLEDLDGFSTSREYGGNEGISEISPCLKLMQTAVVRRPFKVRALAC